MSDWLINLPVAWMAVVLLGLTYLATAAIYTVVTRFAVRERASAFKAISPGMLSPLAVLFALVGFLAAQVWSDAERSRAAVNQEASSLRAVLLLTAAFPGEPETRLRVRAQCVAQPCFRRRDLDAPDGDARGDAGLGGRRPLTGTVDA